MTADCFSWFGGWVGWVSLVILGSFTQLRWKVQVASPTFLARGAGSWLGTSGLFTLCGLDLVVSGQWTKEVKLDAPVSLKAYLEFGVEWHRFYHILMVKASYKPILDSRAGKYTPPFDKKRGEIPLQSGVEAERCYLLRAITGTI